MDNILKSLALTFDVAPLVFAMTPFIALLLCSLLISLRPALSRFWRERGDASAVQASHEGNPPRCGGLAIFAAICLSAAWLGTSEMSVALPLLLSALPAVVAGTIEDFGYGVSPLGRLVASAVAAICAIWLCGLWVPRSDIVVLDTFMQIPAVAILITVFFSAGFCHALNLTDGMNGLASTVIVSGAIGLAAVASLEGQTEVALFALLLAAAGIGFFLLNWPFGLIFLGDAGSYGLAHLLIWCAFILAWTSDAIAIPALLLILFWPFADTTHTIVRRLLSGARVAAPDRFHMHQVLRRSLEIMWLGRGNKRVSNPVTSLFLIPLIMSPVALGIVLHDQPLLCWIAFVLCGLAFTILHRSLVIFTKRHDRMSRRRREVSVARLRGLEST
ncbi:UDP-N-acetylmuramyl pentapeptide phosphotransferase/UDP-N-acetylglucosamine-1-phosphate transferase [Roseivivax halotolerans]|uniref:UDP-N-acetylmuramyl pentapeptide phosphotransferase/UDP-N-acetylglucosamine-1-phosphate transferase n=1 Tax=Roseivivax halotolerans TaxID=93684 RepID=A0A1I6A2J1_9RHOB|nr:UDP-N-acetylmuramyl pentapeptide phosphotransferase/UDP-N-acetylglucosamine-1-phosphate transferase [Roseivivax halotolerans]